MNWTFSFPGFRPTYKPSYEEWGGDRQCAASVRRTDQYPKGWKWTESWMIDVSGSSSLPWKETLCNTSGIKRAFHKLSWLTWYSRVTAEEQLEHSAVHPTLPACPLPCGQPPKAPHQQNVGSATLHIRHNIPRAVGMILEPCVNTVQRKEDHFRKSHP